MLVTVWYAETVHDHPESVLGKKAHRSKDPSLGGPASQFEKGISEDQEHTTIESVYRCQSLEQSPDVFSIKA